MQENVQPLFTPLQRMIGSTVRRSQQTNEENLFNFRPKPLKILEARNIIESNFVR